MSFEILNHLIRYLNRNISEEFNVNSIKNFLVVFQFVYNYIFLHSSRKHTYPLCVKVIPWYGLSKTFSGGFLTLLIIQLQYPIIVLYAPPVVLNAFADNLRVNLGGVVDDNMVYTLSHLASIGLNYFLLVDKVEAFFRKFPQTHLKNCVTIIILYYAECVIITYSLGCVHKSMLP